MSPREGLRAPLRRHRPLGGELSREQDRGWCFWSKAGRPWRRRPGRAGASSSRRRHG